MDSMTIKVGMFGGGGVEKTSISLRYLKGEFSDGYVPTIEDEFSKVIEVDNKTISLTIIDTAGQDDFADMRMSYFSEVQGMVLVFDIGNPTSIDDIRGIYRDAEESLEKGIPHVIAANKGYLSDERDQDLVPKEEYKNLESEFKCKVFEVNVKTGTGVDELFTDLIKQIVGNEKTPQKTGPEKKANTKKETENGEGGCCIIE